ncbi:MAG TPA: endolytic transglycosylase MltG, partial [Sphingomicrobium sp.]|nr:endolytic transglycosylase MltG [Sphingomicrobium sp.]
MKKLLAGGAAAAVLAALAVLYLAWWGPGPRDKPLTLVVAEGSTLASVARHLEREGAIPGTARTFRVMARLLGSGDPIQAGEFEVPAGLGGSAILDLLQHGKPVQRLVTVTEGMPSIIVAERLAANAFLTGPVPPIAEGSVLPDSYSFERGELRAAV